MTKALFTSVLTGGFAFVALSFASIYAPLVLSVSLARTFGPSLYLGLVSVLAGGVVGACVGAGYAAFLGPQRAWLLATVGLSSLAYLAFAMYARGGWDGPGWWTPLADAAAFVLACIWVSSFVWRSERAHAI